jgi:uncharacterized protein YrzB (UPF0473 family)
MDAIQKKERLHLRIEQANEQILDALAEMAEVLFKTWQPEVTDGASEEPIGYQAGEPMTTEVLKAKITKAENQIDQGEYLTPEELEKEAQVWLRESIA